MSENAEVTAEAGENNDQSAAFRAPASQEELDRIIGDRLARERSKYADYDDLKSRASRVEELEAINGELTGKVQTFEAEKERNALLTEVSTATGVPASALRGNTREELEAHAAALAELIKPSGPVIPGQEKAPTKIPDSPNAEFARKLFGSD